MSASTPSTTPNTEAQPGGRQGIMSGLRRARRDSYGSSWPPLLRALLRTAPRDIRDPGLADATGYCAFFLSEFCKPLNADQVWVLARAMTREVHQMLGAVA